MDKLLSSNDFHYPATRSLHSQKASESALFTEHAPRALHHVAKAAEARDLFHPDGWHAWLSSPDEAVLHALATMNPKEAPFASGAVDHHSHGIAYVFAERPIVLRAMREAGIDIDHARSFLGNPISGRWIAPAFLLAWENEPSAIVGLIDAGIAPPGRLSAEEGRLFNSTTAPRTVSHLLAGVGCETGPSPAVAARICAWLGDDQLNVRDHLGRTALAIAASGYQFTLAHALLDAGANPFLPDGKNRSVRMLFERAANEKRFAASHPHEISAFRARLDAIDVKNALEATPDTSTPRPRHGL